MADDTPDELDEAFRPALLELEQYLDALPRECSADLVRPLAACRVLADVGLDLVRLREETQMRVGTTPSAARISSGDLQQVGAWVSRRMLSGESEGGEDLGHAQECLANARNEITRRADTIDAARFSRAADGVRLALGEKTEADPAADPLWGALAMSIAESAMP